MSLKKILNIGLRVLFCVGLAVAVNACGGSSGGHGEDAKTNVKILFTADLHSSLLPHYNDDYERLGGYAKIKTLINEQKEEFPYTLLLDGGDFSAGSLFQTTYQTQALELRSLGALGIEYTTFGNHEFDYGASGVANMLNSAIISGEPLPEIIQSMYLPDESSSDVSQKQVVEAYKLYGVKKYALVEKNGIYFAIFSSYGVNADEDSPNSQMTPKPVTLQDRIDSANEIIAAATEECQEKYGVDPVVVCLSHAGIKGADNGEDIDLAKNVSGIDIIISAHEHLRMEEPVIVNNTHIFSIGANGEYLGALSFEYGQDESLTLVDYSMLPITDSIEEDGNFNNVIENYKFITNVEYLSHFDVSFDDVVVNNPYEFYLKSKDGSLLFESTLANLVTDAYRAEVEKITGEPIALSITAAGVLRSVLAKGDVTVSDVFNVVPLGVGADNYSGYPLIKTYLSGLEIKTLASFDAILYAKNTDYQLFFSGINYTVSVGQKAVTSVTFNDGSEMEDYQLYPVIVDSYFFDMASQMGASFGFSFRDQLGNAISPAEKNNYIVHTEDGVELKCWFALYKYLKAMDGKVSSAYSEVDGRKIVID